MTMSEDFRQDESTNGKALNALRDELSKIGTMVLLGGQDEDAARKAIEDAYPEGASEAGMDIPDEFFGAFVEECVRLAKQNSQGLWLSTGPAIGFD